MIDWDRVTELREEIGAEDFDEVVEIFLDEVGSEVDALSSQNASCMAEKLHYLKGSALNLGFRAFSELCQKGEVDLSQNPGAELDVQALLGSYHESRSVFLNDLPLRFNS